MTAKNHNARAVELTDIAHTVYLRLFLAIKNNTS